MAVEGSVLAKQIKVKTDISVPDYVFDFDYDLPSLQQISEYVKSHKHLPEIPSAKEIEADGLDVAEMNLLLLKKVEELTLYLIDQGKTSMEQKRLIEDQAIQLLWLQKEIQSFRECKDK